MIFEVSQYTDFESERERGITAYVHRHPDETWYATVVVRLTGGRHWVADWMPGSKDPQQVIAGIRLRFARVPDVRPCVALFGAFARAADYRRRPAARGKPAVDASEHVHSAGRA